MRRIDRRTFIKSGGGAFALAGVASRDAFAANERPRTRTRPAPPEEITGIQVVGPSCVEVGESFSVGVKMLTHPHPLPATCFHNDAFPATRSAANSSFRGCTYMDNVPATWEGELVIESGGAYRGPDTMHFSGGPGLTPDDLRPIARMGPVQFSEPGVHFLRLTDPNTGVTRLSNPIRVGSSPTDRRLYWGDVHMHTHHTDGIRNPEQIYHFGREESFLDICAITDHAEMYITDRLWEYFTAVANDFYDPGRFVTLIAQEWTSRIPGVGHRCLYHRGDEAPILRASDPVWRDITKLFEEARTRGTLVVPHHSASERMGVDWTDVPHDPRVERLVEMHSIWGNSERPESAGNDLAIKGVGTERNGRHVVDALEMGRTYGVIASGDVHDGRPGDDLMSLQQPWDANPDHYTGGLMGVWAGELSRTSVFDAMWNRRVFGTTGPRIILNFEADGQPMGSTVPATGGVRFSVTADSEVPIERMDLVRDGEDVRSHRPRERHAVWHVDDGPSTNASSYYVRVTRVDGEMAWSSPIWVRPA